MAVLTVDAQSSMDAARADVDSMGAAVRGLGDDVRAASDDARQAGVDFDSLGEGSDNVASKSSQAAGAMGDLAGGLEAIGATGAATALEGVALGSQVAAGAGDALNLVAETSVGRFIAQTAASVAHRTASIAGAVATGAMTAAQAALNAVMAVNPIVLVVVALAALAAGLVFAYKHSETFRNIVDGAFSRARDVVEAAAGAVEDIIGWFKDLPGEAREAWSAVADAVGDKVGDAVGFVEDLVDDVKRLPREAAAEVAQAFATMFAPIQTAIGWVDDLIDRIGDIDFPSIDIPGLPRVGGKFGPTTTVEELGGTPTIVELRLSAAPQDQDSAMRTLVESLRDYFARQGLILSLTEAPA